MLRTLHLGCIATYVLLAAYVSWRVPGLRRGVAFAMISACFAVWSASLLLAHDPDASEAMARVAYDIGAVAWAAFAPCCLLFALAFAGRRMPRWLPLAAAPAPVFMIQQWRGVLAAGYSHQPWGWAYVWSSSPWTYLYYAYYQSVVVVALLVVVGEWRRATDRMVRRQAAIIAGTALVPFVLSTLTDIVLPRLGNHAIPNVAPAFLLPWVGGIAIAILRYRLLEISPETAATEIVASMSDGILLVDLEGVVVRGNPAAADLLGREPNDLRAARLDAILTPQERADGMLRRSRPADDRVVSLATTQVRDRRGAAIGSIYLLRDVTARERVAETLRQARDELETRVRERTRELDTANQELRLSSRTLEGLLAAVDAIHKGGTVGELAAAVATAIRKGIAPGALTGCRVTIDQVTYTSPDFVAGEAPLRVAIRTGSQQRGEIELQLAAGVQLHERELVMLDAVAGEVAQSIDAVAMQQTLARAERLASMGLLSAGVAHEINNPLAFVTANLEELESRELEPDAVRARAREALEGTRRIARIVRELGTFARARDDQATVDVQAPTEAAIAIARNELRHRARLVIDLGGPASVRVDPGRLTQVMLDLLINAIHALPDRADGNEIGVKTWVENDEVFLQVRDNGAGIAADDLPRLFEPFFSRKRVGEGSGLGLSISHGIVTAAGGRIAVESKLGEGSCFTVAFPRAAGVRAATPRAPVPVPAGPAPVAGGRKRRILIVDDDDLVGRALARMLRDYDVAVVEAIEVAKDRLAREVFDLVISDIMMPGGTAEDLVEWIAGESPVHADRVVLMTGGVFTPRSEELARRMSERILKKPFERHEVRALVERYIAKAS